ncbi:MAG: GntR family transcriptional regulator [Sphaerochaeta sp.]|jgi:DNA-binding GntR family transcriptional regulator|nr:GntR family transcriptional regulator [Sphaerochaeta sp.]
MAESGKKIALTIKDQVYNIIKENILAERYKPGERVSEIVLANELGVSRSPVRSAINELVGEGLLEAKPHHYVRVRKLTEKEIIDVYEMRLLVEQYAIRKAVETLDDKMRHQLKKFANDFRTCCTYDHLTKYVELDTRFHQYLIDLTGNQLVIDTFARIGAMITSFRIISLKSLERFNESIVEHTGIIEGICDGDAERAIEACRVHLTLAKNEIVLSLQNTPAQ